MRNMIVVFSLVFLVGMQGQSKLSFAEEISLSCVFAELF